MVVGHNLGKQVFVGKPPYYTTSLLQLINQIVKDEVQWPEHIDPTFKADHEQPTLKPLAIILVCRVFFKDC